MDQIDAEISVRADLHPDTGRCSKIVAIVAGIAGMQRKA
jgi:hypothetical protein